MTRYLKNFLKYFPLLKTLVERDIKIKYRRSVLGVLWTLLNPLLMMTIMSIVFANLFKFSVENYAIYILSGQVIFNFFNDATNQGLYAIIASSQLIKKVYVPKYLFVISRVFSSMINFMASFTALLLVMIVQKIDLHYTVILSIVQLLLISIFSTGIAMSLSALTVKFRDIIHLWGVFTTALMYLTPVIYPISLMENHSNIKMIVELNPITNYLGMFRSVIMYNTLFSSKSLLIGMAEACVVFLIGLFVFYKRQDTFILDV